MNLAGKKILVTGGGGFVGSHLLAAMRQAGLDEADSRVPRSVTRSGRRTDWEVSQASRSSGDTTRSSGDTIPNS